MATDKSLLQITLQWTSIPIGGSCTYTFSCKCFMLQKLVLKSTSCMGHLSPTCHFTFDPFNISLRGWFKKTATKLNNIIILVSSLY